MESVGQQLRAARLRLGLGLEVISAKTRISIKNLEAIEQDDLKQINTGFFYKSFVKQFAQAVGLEHALLANAIELAVGQMPEPLVPGQKGAPVRPDLPGLRPEHTRKLLWVASLGSLVMMVFVCSSLYGVWQASRSQPHSSVTPAAAQPAPGNSPAPQRQAEIAQQPAPQAFPDIVRVQLSALESTWLSVAADGKEVFSGTLEAEQQKTLEGRQSARVRTGNAGGVEVVFNGRTIGRLGRKGEVRTVVFTRNGYNFVETDQQHVAMLIFKRIGE